MTLINLADFTDLFPWIIPPDQPLPPRYNIAPTQPIAVVPNLPEPKIDFYHWGLIPSWAKDPAIGNRMINARAETLAEKPAFARLLRRRRCLVISSGFYEWKAGRESKKKTPMFIHMKDDKPLAFAGLWDIWHDSSGSEVPSATVITTVPNELMKQIHDRMPVILPPEGYRLWLDPEERNPAELLALLKPAPAEQMVATAVSDRVNSPKFESPECIRPVAGTDEAPTLFG